MEHLVAEVESGGGKVDFNNRVKHGLTPLHLAVAGTHRSMAKWLIAHGADPQIQDNAGSTPLHVAYRVGSAGIGRDLIALDPALKHIEDTERKTPLDYDCSIAGTMANILKALSHTWELQGHVKIADYSAQLEGAFADMFLPYLEEGLSSFVAQYPGLISEHQHALMSAFIDNAINFGSYRDTLGRAPAGVLKIGVGGTVCA